MRVREPWFGRSFTFDLTLSAVPGLIERLRGTPARLRQRLVGVSHERLTFAPEGQWSIKENVGHLGDLEPLWRGRVADILLGRETMREADLENRRTHEAGHDHRALQILLFDFQSERGDLVTRLEGTDGDAWLMSARHPRLGTSMRLLDLAYFVAEHDDHHLAAITELLHVVPMTR